MNAYVATAYNGTDPMAAWVMAIVLLLVVTVVAWGLLRIVIATACSIKSEVAHVWANGQRVANNTIHIPSLYATRDAVGAIIDRVVGIAGQAKAIELHAQECSGCPACFLKKPG